MLSVRNLLLLEPIFFDKFFLTKTFSGPKLVEHFVGDHFFGPRFFGQKYFCEGNSLGAIFSWDRVFWEQNFLIPNFLWLKMFLTKILSNEIFLTQLSISALNKQ